METVLWLKLLMILVLIMGNAYFVGAEVAITGARRSKIRQLADQGNKAALRVQELHNEPERFYSVTQIGITLVSLALGAVGMDTLAQIMNPWFEGLFSMFGQGERLMEIAHTTAWFIAFCIISFLHVVAGELAPKILAFHKAEPIAMAVSWSVNAQYIAWTPVIWAMKHASNFLLWTWGQKDLIGSHGEHFTMTQEEIRTIISASEGAGVLKPEETQMIRGVFDLDEHTVRDAMIPRTEILALAKDASLGEAMKLFKETPHARFPVYDGTMDNIIGIVAIKELLSIMAESGENMSEVSKRPVSQFVNPPFIVPNSKSLSDLLKEFKRTRQQMAIVIDEYGGTEGVITLEDILEEIVGEYEDEFTRQARRVKKLEGSQYDIDASMRVSDLEDVLAYPFPSDRDYVTLAGMVYKHLGRVPKMGDVVELESARLVVMEMDNHRITRVRFEDLKVAEDGSITLAESHSPADAPHADDMKALAS
ncbi:MAG: HlyC/CorC family transporter [Magnetococcales bacterium]|nr:HlyC/CorC family transporter [Magnetococcales bacterium]